MVEQFRYGYSKPSQIPSKTIPKLIRKVPRIPKTLPNQQRQAIIKRFRKPEFRLKPASETMTNEEDVEPTGSVLLSIMRTVCSGLPPRLSMGGRRRQASACPGRPPTPATLLTASNAAAATSHTMSVVTARLLRALGDAAQRTIPHHGGLHPLQACKPDGVRALQQ